MEEGGRENFMIAGILIQGQVQNQVLILTLNWNLVLAPNSENSENSSVTQKAQVNLESTSSRE